MYVLTIISKAKDRELWKQINKKIEMLSFNNGYGLYAVDWLDEFSAADFLFKCNDSQGLLSSIQQILAESQWQVDYIVQKKINRRKKVLVADMEATIIAQEMIDEMAQSIGSESEVASITAQAMSGNMEFSESLAKRAKIFAGQPENLLEKMLDRIQLNPGAETMVKTLSHHNVYTAIVTGGFQPFADYVKKWCGFSEANGNHLQYEGGVITGQLHGRVIDRQGKKICAEKILQQLSLTAADLCTVGDGANDIDMFDYADLAVGLHPKPIVEKHVGLIIRHTDLTSLLFAQGYKREEFVEV